MHLLYPSFLWALFALAIPIIVHLFNFRKAKLVRFSNVKFLEAVNKKSASTRNLKHLLILASRLLFLFFLVITFAQPYFPGVEQGLSGSQVDIYIDNSPSMANLTEENITGLSAAVQLGERILELYPDDTKFRLLTNDFDPASNNYRSKENTLNHLFEIDFSSALRTGDDVMQRIQRQGSIGNDIFFISDFQKSTIGQMKSPEDSLNQFHFIPVFFNDMDNLLVDSVFLKTPFVIDGQRNQLIVKVRNPTRQPVEDLAVKLQLNGRQSASASVTLNPESTRDVVFELDQNLLDINRGVVSIEDYPIAFDNEYNFSFSRVKNIRIVEITEKNQVSEIGKIFAENALFNFKKFEKGSISFSDVTNADLLILNALQEIENGLKNPIEMLLRSGKAVVVVPHATAHPDNFREMIGITMEKTEAPEKSMLEAPKMDHPFFENIFEESNPSSVQPSARISWTWQALDHPVLTTKTGASFLSQLPQKGNLFLFATSFELEHTDFTRNALFVPVFQRIAEKSSALNHQLAYTLDRPVLQVQLDSLSQNDLFKLKNETDEIVPTQKANGNVLFLDLPRYLMTPGYYDLVAKEKLFLTLAFNQARAESDLAVLPVPEIEDRVSRLKNVELHVNSEVNTFSKSMKDKYHRAELWKYALILSLVFLVAEILLIRYL